MTHVEVPRQSFGWLLAALCLLSGLGTGFDLFPLWRDCPPTRGQLAGMWLFLAVFWTGWALGADRARRVVRS